MRNAGANANQVAQSLLPLLQSGLAAIGKTLLVGTALTLIGMTVAVLVGSKQGHFAPRILSAVAVGGIGLVAVFMLAMKRAVFAVAAAGLTKLSIGTSLLQLIFERVLQVSDANGAGDRGGRLAEVLETKIPLAQAESRLRSAVAKVTLERHGLGGLRGWLLSRVRSALLSEVERLTLARFRAEGQSRGAVDLLRLRDELGQGLDGLLVDRVESISNQTTLLVVSVALVLSALCVGVVHQYL